jgi:hypothetical protein
LRRIGEDQRCILPAREFDERRIDACGIAHFQCMPQLAPAGFRRQAVDELREVVAIQLALELQDTAPSFSPKVDNPPTKASTWPGCSPTPSPARCAWAPWR